MTVDPRVFRFDQALLALALISGYVFEAPAVIPVWASLSAATAVFSVAAPVPQLFSAFVAPRLDPGAGEDDAPWRVAALVSAVLLGLGSLTLAFGNRALAWLFALVVAAGAALGGVGNLCIGCRLYRRRPGRPGRH